MTNEIALPQITTLQLVSNARRALAEARALPDFQRVMEAATVAADAAHRVAKLMEAQGMAADVVRAANEAANDAAAVRIEAQAGAGRILREMKESGELRAGGPGGGRPAKESPRRTLSDLGLDRQGDDEGVGLNRKNAWKWQKVADIPGEVRAEYVDETVARGGEITTAGLMRHAREAPPEREPTVNDSLEKAYAAACEAMAVFVKYRNASAIAAFAADSRRKTRFRELVDRSRAWLDEAEQVLR